MIKPFAVLNRNTGRYVEFFEYPIQAENYIKGSNAFKVLDLRKKK